MIGLGNKLIRNHSAIKHMMINDMKYYELFTLSAESYNMSNKMAQKVTNNLSVIIFNG